MECRFESGLSLSPSPRRHGVIWLIAAKKEQSPEYCTSALTAILVPSKARGLHRLATSQLEGRQITDLPAEGDGFQVFFMLSSK